MPSLLSKIFSLLRTNKKKSFAGLFLAVLYIIYRRKGSLINFDPILNGVQKRLLQQLEQNFRSQQKLGEKLKQMEDIRSAWEAGLPDFRDKAAKQIGQLFLIGDLKEDLKKKDLKPMEKQSLWDRFKDETLLFCVMGLTVFPLMSLIKGMKEMIFGRFVNQEDSPVKAAQYIRIIERILDDFTEQLIESGVRETFFYLQKKLQGDFAALKVSHDVGYPKLFEILSVFESKTLGFIEKHKENPQKPHKTKESFGDKGVYWKNGISEKVSGVDYDEIGNYLMGKSKTNKNPSKGRLSSLIFGAKTDQKLTIPSVLLEILSEFLGKSRSNTLLTDPKHALSVVNHLKTIETNENVLEGLDKSPEIIDENLLIKKTREEKLGNEDFIVTESVMGLCQELLEWVESTNFQVLYYHSIRFGFFRLKTRLLLHRQKTKTETQKMANFLTLLYRLVNEEFLEAKAEDVAEGFYKNRVKANLASLGGEGDGDVGDMRINVRILEEYEMSLRVKESVMEVFKRVYMEEMFEEIPAPSQEKQTEGKEFNEILTVLKQLG